MKIKDWEKYVYKKYNAIKINNFLDLKKYLTSSLNYAHNFTPEEITETEISNEDFYAAYVFDENKIAGRNVLSKDNSGWNTTIVFIASKDRSTISDYFIHESNGLYRSEMDKFCREINPFQDKWEHKMTKKALVINYIILITLFILNIFASIYFFTVNSTVNNTAWIFNENILKVVEIKVSDDEQTWGYATGFFIDANGTILTNKHVAYNSLTNRNFNIIQVRLPTEDEWYEANVVKVSETDDLATIKIDKTNTNYFKLEENISNGESIYTIGNPNGFGLSFSSGVISSSERNVIYNEQTITAIQTSLVINEGNSGGPVFNSNGNLVGIISFRLKDKYGEVIQGVSFALPSSKVETFLKG